MGTQFKGGCDDGHIQNLYNYVCYTKYIYTISDIKNLYNRLGGIMQDYIKRTYTFNTCAEMGNRLNMTQFEVYKECRALADKGLIDRRLIRLNIRTNIDIELEDKIMELYPNNSYNSISEKVGKPYGTVSNVIKRLVSSGLMEKKTKYLVSTEGMEEFVKKKTAELVIQDAKDLIVDKEKNRIALKANDRRLGEVIEVPVIKDIVGLVERLTVIEIFSRFYLCQSEFGWKTCINRS